MNVHTISLKRVIPIIILCFGQLCGVAFPERVTKQSEKGSAVWAGPGGRRPSMEKIISDKIKASPKVQMAQYQTQAAKRLQSNLARSIQVLTRNDKRIPPNVRNSAKAVLKSLKSGQLTQPLTKALPSLLVTIPQQQQGNAGQQLGTTLQNVLPYAPQGTKPPLQVLLSYVKENLNGVNALLLGTISGIPNLLEGVIGSLVGSLGGLNDTLGNTLDSVGAVLGGLLG